jgi:hypothetical protein
LIFILSTNLEFKDYLVEVFPNVHVFNIPKNCKSKLQPCNLIVQKPFKYVVYNRVASYAFKIMTKKMTKGSCPKAPSLDTSIGTFKNFLYR